MYVYSMYTYPKEYIYMIYLYIYDIFIYVSIHIHIHIHMHIHIHIHIHVYMYMYIYRYIYIGIYIYISERVYTVYIYTHFKYTISYIFFSYDADVRRWPTRPGSTWQTSLVIHPTGSVVWQWEFPILMIGKSSRYKFFCFFQLILNTWHVGCKFGKWVFIWSYQSDGCCLFALLFSWSHAFRVTCWPRDPPTRQVPSARSESDWSRWALVLWSAFWMAAAIA